MRLSQLLIAIFFTFFTISIVAQNLYDENESFENLSLGVYYQHGPGTNNTLNWKYQYGTKLTVNAGIFRNFEITSIDKLNSGYAVRQFNQNTGLWTGWRNFLIDDGSGNVGIGTTTPNSKLHVNGEVRSEKGFIISGNSRFTEKGSNLHIWSIADMEFGTGGVTSKMILDTNGNVGIGTTNPQNKLSVNGTIWAKKIRIKLTDAADWVFEDDYNLRPLSEVAAFIKANKHLPEIPSAEEFRKNDMEVSEMTNKLLQKIEELTLYTIEQEKELKKMEVLETKLAAQNEKLVTQEARLQKLETLLVK